MLGVTGSGKKDSYDEETHGSWRRIANNSANSFRFR
jgi:hypothetical protein